MSGFPKAGGDSGVAPRWPLTGNYYHLLSLTAPSATSIPAEGDVRASPFWVPAGSRIDRLATEITVVGTAGALIRLGLYADNGDGTPGALIIDGGTIDGTVLNMSEVTFAPITIPSFGWAVQCVQGGAGTRPTTRFTNTPTELVGGHTNLANARFQSSWVRNGGVAGALPATFGSVLPLDQVPITYARQAA